MRSCSKCKNEKPESEFYRDKATRNGLSSACKDCIWTKKPRKTPMQRFSSMVRVTGRNCWEWSGYVHINQYGYFSFNGTPTTAHRFSYLSCVGDIASGNDVHHLCENRLCVNPSHLTQMTRSSHISVSPAGKSYWANAYDRCKHGHDYTDENTYMVNGYRQCRICKQERFKKWRMSVRP